VTTSPARRLILAYAALAALWFAYVALPGGVRYPSPGQATFWAAVDALVVWRLWHGSALACVFALVVDLLAVVLVALSSINLGTTEILVIAFSAAQLMILVSGPVRRHVWSGPRRQAAAS
jgi:hypothetical protein